jgi:hypothetical protein
MGYIIPRLSAQPDETRYLWTWILSFSFGRQAKIQDLTLTLL